MRLGIKILLAYLGDTDDARHDMWDFVLCGACVTQPLTTADTISIDEYIF